MVCRSGVALESAMSVLSAKPTSECLSVNESPPLVRGDGLLKARSD